MGRLLGFAGSGAMKLVGDKPLLAILKKLPNKVSNKIIRDAVNKGAGIIKKEAGRRAPRGETGELSKSMIVKQMRKKHKELSGVVVGPRNKVILKRRRRDTKKHRVKGLRKAALFPVKAKGFGKLTNVSRRALQAGKFQGFQITRVNPGKYGHLVERGRKPVIAKGRVLVSKDDGTVFGKRVVGVAARPFMRPAFELKKRAALSAIRVKLWKGIRQEVLKF